jgi:hypothetical protein
VNKEAAIRWLRDICEGIMQTKNPPPNPAGGASPLAAASAAAAVIGAGKSKSHKSKSGRGAIENKHSTDVKPTNSRHVCTSINPDGSHAQIWLMCFISMTLLPGPGSHLSGKHKSGGKKGGSYYKAQRALKAAASGARSGPSFHASTVPIVLCVHPGGDGVSRYVSYSEVQGVLRDGGAVQVDPSLTPD